MAGSDRFVTEWDGTPSFWNYLLGLDRADLVAELVQNDLDQEATLTVLSFERDRLVCEGDGRPVEADGWQRLRKMQGAGDSVPAKRRKIGVKNHGLKTAFTIGDELELSSAGQRIVQTLYANGRDKPPYPGASPEPRSDPHAPTDGCRVTVWYRTTDLEPLQGEASVFGAFGKRQIDDLFVSACTSAPAQFAGIAVPEVAPRYEIVLRHWRLGEARFSFSCTRPRKIAQRIELFRRACAVSGTATDLPEGLNEQAARRLVPAKRRLSERVPDFFRRDKRFFVEVAWPIDRRGKPLLGVGRYRYPIGYPRGSAEALTGHGAHISAPLVSDNARRGLAKNEATNVELLGACESLLTDAIAHYAVPAWGPRGLDPLVPTSDADITRASVRHILAALTKRNAMPVLSWRNAAQLLWKRRKQQVREAERRIRLSTNSKRTPGYRFVVPAATWTSGKIHPALSLLCPSSEKQLDPRVSSELIRLLEDQETSGFSEEFVTFDENDVIDRVTGDGNEWFPGISNPTRVFAEPLVAGALLDLTEKAINERKRDPIDADELMDSLLLPDRLGRATSFRDLYSSAPLPLDVPGLRLPRVLHSDLVNHSIFRHTTWRLPKYTMAEFLDSGTLQTADENTRRNFWNWLHHNHRRIGRRERPKLADLAIWLDVNGVPGRIADLCEPRSRLVGRTLGESIRRPHDQLRRSKLVSAHSRARARIRPVPTQDEITDWLTTWTARFSEGKTAGAGTAQRLRRFEAGLATLLNDAAITRLLRKTQVSLPALAKDGSIRPRGALLLPTRSNNRLALPPRFVLEEQNPRHSEAVARLSACQSEVTPTMILSAFREDPRNWSALQARLRDFLRVTESGDNWRLELRDTPFLPVGEQPRSPSELAFRGNRGDYWGEWKTVIPIRALSQDDQRRYVEAGVTSGLPDPSSSRAFFEWLSAQDSTALRRHIPCVLRQILHRDGPTKWAESFSDMPFIPARGYGDRLELLSLRAAKRRPVFLPHASNINETIIRRDRAVWLVIDRVREVAESISEPLSRLRVRSLHKHFQEPVRVTGTGDVAKATTEIRDLIEELQTSGFRRSFRKRLGELGVESRLLRNNWHDRLGSIKNIHSADKVEGVYRFRGKPYLSPIDAGFDRSTGIFWLRNDQITGAGAVYRALAAQMVFKTTARPIDHFSLEHARALDIRDPTYGSVDRSKTQSGYEAADNAYQNESDDDGDDRPTEATFGHSPFEPDPARNTPHPVPIPSGEPRTRRRQYRKSQPSSEGREHNVSQAPPLEREQIRILKQNLYSSHCQMCLCKHPPRELAPTGSYIEWEEVRRRVVEAHHVDPKSGGGARHAGNLILLCKLHHDNYGRRLTRAAITSSLRADARKDSVQYGGNSAIQGVRIEVSIPDTGEIVEFFFMKEHVDYWLSEG